MAKLRIQIIGPTGAGKSTVANMLRFQLEGNVQSLEFSDDTPLMENHVPSVVLGQGGLSKTDVTIETIQVQRKDAV